MTIARWTAWGVAALFLATLLVSCKATDKTLAPGELAGQEAAASLTPNHVGKRVRAVLKMGAQTVIGKVIAVDPSADAAAVETDYGSRIGFKISHVSILEEFDAAKPVAQEAPDRAGLALSQRFTFADRIGGNSEKAENTANVKVLVVDFRHQHRCAECLRDLEEPLLSSPSSALFTDKASTVTVRVPIPKDATASLVPFSWHAHIIGGTKESPTDSLAIQNSDGELSFVLKDFPDARKIVLVGTPHRIQNKLYGIDAIAPPRMFAIDVFEAAKANGILENNRAIMHGLDLKAGKLYVASQPANDSEMILSVYDPEKRNAANIPDIKFSVQDALLFPALSLTVTDPQGLTWQKLGAYPIPPFLSQESPDLNRIALEIGPTKRGEFAGPPIAGIRSSETANIKTEVDVRYNGLATARSYRMIVAHGLPNDADKRKLYNPTAKEVRADTKSETVLIDLSKAEESAFPAEVFFWSQLAAPWKTSGGFMEGTTPMTAPKKIKAPPRRVAVYPAHSPGLRFVSFAGPKAELAAGTPALLGTNGIGGSTLGSGGAYVPFSPIVGIGMIDTGNGSSDSQNGGETNSGSLGTLPLVIPAISPHTCSTATASASASASATAIAICNCGGGGCGDGSGKAPEGGDGGGGGKQPPPSGKKDVPTYDPRFPPPGYGGGFPPGAGTPIPVVSTGGGMGGLSFGSTSGW